MPAWELRQEPHRAYWRTKEGEPDKWTWNGRDKVRIASVTTVLDGDMDRLLDWAVGKAFTAFEHVLNAHGGVFGEDNRDLGELCQATGLMPDTYRDLKGDIGTAGHAYLAAVLAGCAVPMGPYDGLPYGYRLAIDAFLDDTAATPVHDERGPCIERAVGDEVTAVAGTYDAVVTVPAGGRGGLAAGVHRIDLKSSNSLHPKQMAQLAEYERLAVLCGEDRSDHLTIIHIDGLGNWKPWSIPTGGPEEQSALAYFDAALALYRLGPRLRKGMPTW